MAKTVLVTGATGNQGGHAARAIMGRGHRVRGLTRHPDGDAARALRDAGAEIVEGDFDRPDTIERAARDVDVAYVMSTPFEAGMEAETRQGTAAVDAAAAGAGHVIYASVASADRDTGIPHFDSKYEVERHVRGLDVPFTILAPVAFMENLLAPWNRDALRNGMLPAPLPRTRMLQQVALADLGAFAALVVDAPDDFAGQRIEIASDEVNGDEMAAIVARVSGHDMAYVEVPLEQARQQSDDIAAMYEWFDRVGYDIDIAGLRKRFPEVGWHGYEEWAREQDWTDLR